MVRSLSLVAALLIACVSTQSSAATLVTDGGGFLTGANGVAFNGVSYDVSFLDLNCTVDSCATPFSNTGTAPTTLTLFAQALLDQVFAAGSFFDLNTQLIRGCEGTTSQCQIHMGGSTTLSGVRATVIEGAVTNVVSNVSAINMNTIPLNYMTIARVDLSAASAVPLPASLPLLAGGLGLIAALRRRRKA
ncbi:VPLPA-CTERM sorting domain-containing protein [Primorskyibacter sp. 2E107]|uniref:VPLPA-CTERM sorting domain-containing protein n=1 Tax=Primorskyibacter sp. 2E107 TaxID=3403458 RepID=UPI003AF72FCE